MEGLQKLVDSVQDPEGLIRRVRQLESDVVEERSRAKAAETLAEDLETALADDLSKLPEATVKADLLKTRQKVSHLEAELAANRLKLLEAYSAGERLESEVLKLRTTVAHDKDELVARDAEQEKVRQEALSKSGELAQKLSDKDSQLARLQELVDRLDSQRTELETQLAISRAEMQEAVQKGWSLSDAERGLKEQLRAQQDRNENLRDKLRQREEDVEEMTRERLHALASSVEARETLDSVQSEINLVFARLVTLREKLRSCDPQMLTKLAEQFRDRPNLAERMKIMREVLELPIE